MSNTKQSTRYGNLGQLYPLGTVIDIVLVRENASKNDGYGKVLYTDGLGVCITEDGKPTFYPWANVVCLKAADQ